MSFASKKIQLELTFFLPVCICQIILDYECKLLKLDAKINNFAEFKNQEINNSCVALINYGNIHPFISSPVFQCCELYLDHCDKNFVRSFLKQQTFPNLKTVFIRSHPCDNYVLNNSWMKKNQIEVFLVENYFNWYKDRWWYDIQYIKEISNEDYESCLTRFVCLC